MYKYLINLVACTGIVITLAAQNVLPVYDPEDYVKELQPGNLRLVADRNICELKEVVNVHVEIAAAHRESLVPQNFLYRFRDPSDAPWTVGDFKIVSGGGRVVMTENEVAQLQMPAVMPKEKTVMVQVLLIPRVKGLAQVQLFTTIYLADSENVFYFNCPYLGINREKYVIKNNGGASHVTDSLTQQAQLPKNTKVQQRTQEYAMKAAGAEVLATEKGFNLAALTSNAKAIYAPDEDLTTILINGDKAAMEDGAVSAKTRMYMIALSFPGKKTGTFKIKTDKKITATITLPQMLPGYACTCAADPDNEQQPACMGGTVTVTKYDGKYIEGTVVAYLESQDGTVNPPVTFFSTLNGKFRVPVATQ